MSIRKGTTIRKFEDLMVNVKGVAAATIAWCIEVIRGLPEEDHSETVAGLEDMLTYFEEEAEHWPGGPDENPWAKDAATLKAAIAALKKEEE